MKIRFALFACLLMLIAACHSGRRAEMMAVLDRADSLNRAFIPITGDSLLRQAADFFDRHGTAAERLRAHYLLGCAYRDLGQAPEALQSFQDAIDRADTLSSDCDYHVMGCVCSQMADLYYQQLLLSNEINARKQSRHYALLDGDTLMAVSEMRLSAGTYILQNKRDSAETALKEVMLLYEHLGQQQMSLQASVMLMHVYTDQLGRQAELKHLIDKYESDCSLFDVSHELPPGKRQFYYYKARFLENQNYLDSAEYYYRKVYSVGTDFVQCEPIFKGLLSIYQKRHQPDSIEKYARLYCAANDSSISIKDQMLTAQLSASYNYAILQKNSIDSARKASRNKTIAIILLTSTLIVAAFAFFLWRKNQNRQHALYLITHEYEAAVDNYENKIRQLATLDERHQQMTNMVRRELDKVKSQNEDLLEKNTATQHLIGQLNAQHEVERLHLNMEIDKLRDVAEEWQRQAKVSSCRQLSMSFMKMGIVNRVLIYAKDSHRTLTTEELDKLVEATKECFPDMITDLYGAQDIGKLGILVCILVLLNLPPNAIVHLLGISSSQVANLKKDVNRALFNESTARTLYRNLTLRYKVVAT